jgi:PGF-pre-PGF domain-containing protein
MHIEQDGSLVSWRIDKMKKTFFIPLLLGLLATGLLVPLVAAGAVTVNSATQTSYIVSQNAGTVTINFDIATAVAQGSTIQVTFENFKTISGTPGATLTASAGGLTYTPVSSGAAGSTLSWTVTSDSGTGDAMDPAEQHFTLTITGGSDIVNPTTAGNDVTITVATPSDTGSRDITITPVVTSIAPSSRGAGSTTTSFTITGDGFTNGGVANNGVTIGTATSTAVTYNSITTITATVDVSALGTGTKNVVVVNSGATGTGTNIFTINAAPTFTSSLTTTDGTTIIITFSTTMADPAGKHGQFTYALNGGAAQGFSAVALNATTTKIDLTTSGTAIANGDAVTVSYTPGTIVAADTGVLAAFANQAVTNKKPAPPTFVSAQTSGDGTKIIITFSKAMANPAGKHGQFTYKVNGGVAQSFSAAALNATTTNIDLTTAGTAISVGDTVTVSYTVGTVVAADSGVLATFTNQAVTNCRGTAPAFVSAQTSVAGSTMTITFSKAMANPAGKHGQFTYKVNGGAAQAFSTVALNTDTTKIDLTPAGTVIAFGDNIRVSYAAGTILSADGGVLASFTDQVVTNQVLSTAQPVDNSGDGGSPATGQSSGTTTGTVNVGGNSPVTQVVVTGTKTSGLVITGTIVTGPGTDSPPAGTVYEYMDITAAGKTESTTITGAIISFSVPVSWLEQNRLAPGDVGMSHLVGKTWVALPTNFIQIQNGRAYYTSETPGFSRFAILAIANTTPGVTPALSQTPVVPDKGIVPPVQSVSTVISESPRATTAPVITAPPTPGGASGLPLTPIAVVIIVVVLVGAGGYYLYVKKQNP